jgi:hypothetical protein
LARFRGGKLACFLLFGRLWWVVAIGKRQTERKRVEDEDGEEEEWVLYRPTSYLHLAQASAQHSGTLRSWICWWPIGRSSMVKVAVLAAAELAVHPRALSSMGR